jgi:hypothetical protein
LRGKVAIDATNIMPARQGDFYSYADEVKSFTGGPVAKSFNMNFGVFDKVSAQRVRPSNWYVADDDAVEITDQLIAMPGMTRSALGICPGLASSKTQSGCSWGSNPRAACSIGSPYPANSDSAAPSHSRH